MMRIILCVFGKSGVDISRYFKQKAERRGRWSGRCRSRGKGGQGAAVFRKGGHEKCVLGT